MNYLHLIAHTSLVYTVCGSRSRPQVSKALDGQRISTAAIPRDFEVQVTVICRGLQRELHYHDYLRDTINHD